MESKRRPESKKNRLRCKNFQDEEKAILKTLIKRHIRDIENKNLDTGSNKRKTEAWQKICTSFNHQSKGITRTADQLRTQWKVMKMMAKTIQPDDTKSIDTGGGSHSPAALRDGDSAADNTNESLCDSYTVKMERLTPEKVTVEVDIHEDTDMHNQTDLEDPLPMQGKIRKSNPSLLTNRSTISVSEQAKRHMEYLVNSANTVQTELHKLQTENAKMEKDILLMKREYWRIKLKSVGGQIPFTPNNDPC